jgi:uracil phosphoribosyltransferase
MRVFIADHPLITHKITVLRDKNTPSPIFRELVEELVTLLAYEATRDVAVTQVTVETPLASAPGVRLSKPRPLVVPILRAGLGMLAGMTKLLPSAEVGFLGIKRNGQTLEPQTYAERLPENLSGRQVFIIDPMLATGGTLIDALNYVFERGASGATCVCLLGAPEGLAAVQKAVGERWSSKPISVVLGAMDERLNDVGYIVPGLGDAGDRLYGAAE